MLPEWTSWFIGVVSRSPEEYDDQERGSAIEDELQTQIATRKDHPIPPHLAASQRSCYEFA